MALLLLLWKVPLDIVITAKLLGLVAGCIALWLVLCISRLLIPDRVLCFGPPLLTVASTPFLMWSQRGLETPLVVLLVLWLALCCVDPKRFRWWPLPGALLLLARPEGFAFLFALLPVLGFGYGRWRANLGSILAITTTALALLTVRLLYFHDLVPSPFYIKLYPGSGWGLGQISQYLRHSNLLLLGSPLILVAWRRRFWTHQRIVLGWFILITTAWCVLAKDYMPYVRHLVPAIPLAYVLLVGAVDSLVAGAGRARKALMVGYIAIVFVGTLFFSRSSGDFGESGENTVRVCLRTFVASPASFADVLTTKLRSPSTPDSLDEISWQPDALRNFQSRIGDFLRRNYPADSVVVYDQMGQTPFYAGATMRFIDTLGLTDRTIGRFYFQQRERGLLLRTFDAGARQIVEFAFGEHRNESSETKALDYLFDQNPDLILFNEFALKSDPVGIPATLSQDPRLTDGYEQRYTLAEYTRLYQRKDAPRKPWLDVPAGLSVVPR